jgi:hypothetical protein
MCSARVVESAGVKGHHVMNDTTESTGTAVRAAVHTCVLLNFSFFGTAPGRHCSLFGLAWRLGKVRVLITTS